MPSKGGIVINTFHLRSNRYWPRRKMAQRLAPPPPPPRTTPAAALSSVSHECACSTMAPSTSCHPAAPSLKSTVAFLTPCSSCSSWTGLFRRRYYLSPGNPPWTRPSRFTSRPCLHRMPCNSSPRNPHRRQTLPALPTDHAQVSATGSRLRRRVPVPPRGRHPVQLRLLECRRPA